MCEYLFINHSSLKQGSVAIKKKLCYIAQNLMEVKRLIIRILSWDILVFSEILHSKIYDRDTVFGNDWI